MIGRLAIASAALAASVVGPVSAAHAADPYTPRANVQCTISVPPAVAGQHIRIKVGARTNADKPPTGTVTVQVRRGSHGPVLWNKTIDYKGAPTTVEGPLLIAGPYHVSSQFVPDNAASYRTCRGNLDFKVGVGPTNEHHGPGGNPNGEGPQSGVLPDTGGPDLMWLLLGTGLIGAGATSVVAGRRRAAATVHA